jgi:hypothetical protein
MPSWSRLLAEVDALADDQKGEWLTQRLRQELAQVSSLRRGSNVLLYGSAFLQKSGAGPQLTSIHHEDVNGLMAVIYGMDYSKGLTLILHTPGGVTTAAESFVEYIRAKFPSVETIVPTFAFSAGTMIATGSDRIVMGRQSQIGPVDPQMPMPSTGRFVSAQAIVAQFEQAQTAILGNPANGMVYAPILQSMGPALVREAQTAIDYSQTMIEAWMSRYMFASDSDAREKAARVAAFLNDRSTHLDHSRRIDRNLARKEGLVVEALEDSQDLQEAVLNAYHVMTILFERTQISKIMTTHLGETWIKSWGG